MATIKKTAIRKNLEAPRWGTGTYAIGITPGNTMSIVEQVREGFAYRTILKFEKLSGLSREKIAQFVGIPLRTLTRRQASGRLQADESDRVLRASRIFGLTVELFEGDVDAARQWLLAPQRGLSGETPIGLASTEIGAREVENLIGRLEHGVFT